MALAERLGMTVSRLETEMSHAELMEWRNELTLRHREAELARRKAQMKRGR